MFSSRRGPTCPCCGALLRVVDRHQRFTVPDQALDPGVWSSTKGWWMNGEDAQSSVFMTAPGGFVRALLPVQLARAHTLTFGVWVGVTTDDLKRAYDLWWAPGYRNLVIDGRLANAVPPDVEVGAAVRFVVRDPEHTPYCESSPDPALHALLTQAWAAVDGDPVHPVG